MFRVMRYLIPSTSLGDVEGIYVVAVFGVDGLWFPLSPA